MFASPAHLRHVVVLTASVTDHHVAEILLVRGDLIAELALGLEPSILRRSDGVARVWLETLVCPLGRLLVVVVDGVRKQDLTLVSELLSSLLAVDVREGAFGLFFRQ